MGLEIVLTEAQRRLVEENLFVVRRVIHKSIIVNETIYGFSYEDIYQEGCLWLCKAAASFCDDRQVSFQSYAETVIANGLRTYCRLMCGKQKRQRTIPIYSDGEDQLAMDQFPAEDRMEKLLEEQDTVLLLQRLRERYSGTARRGIDALVWKMNGLSGTEIATIYGVKPNLVGAWISRAAQKLRKDDIFLRHLDRYEKAA